MILLIVLVTKLVSILSKKLRLGSGGTWPGEIALKIHSSILHNFSKQLTEGIILVAGTNGKTTTSLMIKEILEKNNKKVIHNASGANLLNGIVSAFLEKADWLGRVKADYGVFEVDENSLPLVISNFQFPISNGSKLIIVLLNLFRDQLDRYGEVDVIAEKWQKSLSTISAATFVLNCDDPLIAYLGKNLKNTIYFGIEDKKQFLKAKEHATDSTYCLNCGHKLIYEGIYFSHLGIWKCAKCGEKRHKPDVFEATSPLAGQYNKYNTFAAVGVAQSLNIPEDIIKEALSEFKPAFGRQETFSVNGKHIKIFLSKNPTGFNASLRTVLEMNAKHLLLVLNDQIPDGRDISWIWDVDMEMIPKDVVVIASGERVYDLGLRIQYSKKSQITKFNDQMLIIEENLEKAIQKGLSLVDENETMYILATYSAMLETRKILTGRKIL